MPRYRVAREQVLYWYTGRPATCFCHCHVMLSNRGKGPLDDSGAPSADAFQGASFKGGEVHDEPPSSSRNLTRALVVHVSSGFYKPGRNGLGRSEGADGRSAHTHTQQSRGVIVRLVWMTPSWSYRRSSKYKESDASRLWKGGGRS